MNFYQRIKTAFAAAESVPALKQRIKSLEDELAYRTSASIDVNPHGRSFVILLGEYKGQDYVEVFPTERGDFQTIVRQFKERTRYARADRLDLYPTYRGLMERNLR